jgi:hypothetical protein
VEQERWRRQINKQADQIKKRTVYKFEFMEINAVKENADNNINNETSFAFFFGWQKKTGQTAIRTTSRNDGTL